MSSHRVIALLLAGACLSCGLKTRTTIEPTGDAIRPEGAVVASSEPAQLDYVLQSGDRLDVIFPYATTQNFSAVIRPDGRITAPLFGDVEAEGLPPTQLAAHLKGLYAGALQRPDAQVSVTQFGPQPIYVFGEVTKPNRFDWSRNLDLVQALSMAGGVLRSAQLGNVVLLHVSTEGAYRYEVHDLKNMLADKAIRPVFLSPRDIVIVPSSTIADIGIWINQYVNTFLPPIDGFLRGRYYWFLAKDAIRNN